MNEAFNVAREQFGNERLEDFLASHRDMRPRELVCALRACIAAWAEGAEQSDDITILSLEYRGHVADAKDVEERKRVLMEARERIQSLP